MEDKFESYEIPLDHPKPIRLPGTYPAGEPWKGELVIAYALIGKRLIYEYAVLEPEEEVFI